MKIVYISNYLNPHMLPISQAFDVNDKVESFHFIALTRQSDERKNMGFTDINSNYPFVCRAYENADLYKKALELANDADVAIIGEAPDEWVSSRMRDNKLTFLCSERFYKLGLWRRFVPSSYIKKKKRILQYRQKNLYYLTIGAYTLYDLYLIDFPMEKCFQWAYFPEVIRLSENCPKQEKRHDGVHLLWVGRLVNVKHPQVAIKIAEKLMQKNIYFELNFIGSGPLYKKLEIMIQKKGLKDQVHLLGNRKPKEVQNYMEQSDIFLFTSDYWEGWGAVLSEAMSLGCVPVASCKAGSSEILIDSAKNGYIYKNYAEALARTEELVLDPEKRKRLSRAASDTLNKIWNAECAVQRFIAVVEKIQNGQNVGKSYINGPMSSAILYKAKNYIYTQ